MSNNEKLLKFLSRIIESGVLTSQDLKKEIFNNIKFQKENVVNKLDLVSRKEFDVLKKIVQKQEVKLKKLSKKSKKGGKS
tara:strand:+ start:164 stop:403 length:240 start_codon:yes stop_codon:yes gene_type:complete